MSKHGSSKQKTLFQAWEGKVAVKPKSQPVQREKKRLFNAQEAAKMCTVVDLTNDLDDEDLLEAVEVMESSMIEEQEQPRKSEAIETIPGFDNDLGSMWIYPTNYPIRDYQYTIVKSALFKNTLVSLPTGLGKTFIAAVVMYNFYRWYPQGKVVFMAPTKPLVSQQIEACYKIMGIPYDDQAEITGKNDEGAVLRELENLFLIKPRLDVKFVVTIIYGITTAVHKREELWRTKRVFFLTPQVINNDLARGVCPANDIKCIVIDEAHKAQGRHAYCQVINQLAACSRMFRVLALSATPGTDVNSVQQVINNLLISHIEIRLEESLDIRGYSHHRKIEKVVCKLDEKMVAMTNNYLQVIELFTNSLVNKNALYQRDTASYSKYGILLSREQFRKNPPSGLSKYELGTIEGDFATCISLFHGFELLQQHGMRSFYIFLKAMMEGEKGNLRAKTVLNANQTFREMFASLVQMFGHSPNPNVAFTQAGSTSNMPSRPEVSGEYVYSHPKIRKLEKMVLDHFANFAKDESSRETRVMVFCQYRDTVQEITELLQKHRPMVRPMQFVGHSNASGKIAKFTQKDQLKVVSKFRSGGYNTLISTCVGEEGLDIGDVDLIVCFDAHKSPIRLVQRMGRTGRKREGRIVMLVTEGKEERDYNSSLSNRKSIQKAITGNSSRSLHFYANNPRMVPRGLHPQPLKMAMTVKAKPSAVSAPKKKKTKSNNMDISLIIKNEEIKNPIYLTADQVKEWDEKFKLSSNEKIQAKSFPAFGRMECLRDGSSAPQKGELCFAEWNLWQVRLQETSNIGHSSITKNFVEMMNLCDHMKQSEIIECDKNPQDKDSLSTVVKHKSPSKKQKRAVVSKQSNLDNFIAESPCNEDDTLVGIESIIDEEVHDHTNDEKVPVEITPTSSPQKQCAKQTQKAELKILPVHTPKKIPAQNTTKVDPLLDFINDLSDSSGDEQPPPKQTNSEFSDQDTDDEEEEGNDIDCEISDRSQAPHTKFPHPSPPTVDLLDNSFDDAQNFDAEDGQNFTQSFELNFDDDEEDLFCNPQFDSTIKRKSMVETAEKSNNKAKMKNHQTHAPQHDEFVSGFRTMADNEKVANATRTSPIDAVTKSCLSGNGCDPETFSHNFNKTGEDQKIDGCRKPVKTLVHRKGDFSRNFKVENMDMCTDVVGLGDMTKNSKLHKTDIDDLSKEEEENISSLRRFSEIIPQTNDFDENIQDKDSEDIFSNSPNSGIPNFDLNASMDMFSPNFDLGFDIEPTNSAKFGKNTKANIEQSPILNKACKVKKEKQIEENSPGHITMTQKVENRALFADLGKSHDTSKTKIAQVKPQVKFKKSSVSDSIPTPTLPVLEQDMEEPPFLSMRHKRSLDNNSEHVMTKRKKDAPKTPVNSKSALNIDEDSETTEESPLFVSKKQKSQSKKLEFSPESDKSKYSPDRDKLVKKAASFGNFDETPVSRKRRSDDGKRVGFSDNARKHSTPKALVAEDELSDEDFKGADHKRLKAKPCPPKKLLSKVVKDDFVDFEAEVSQDGVPISTDEEDDSEADPAVLEEMKNFVNDASILTQHVGNGPAVDEHAMYLRGNADFFDEGGQFGNNKAKFKLAFNIRSDVDVFSQEPAEHESDYEQDSFVCDDEVQHDSTDFGEITLLDRIDSPILAGKLTRRQVELNRLKKFNKDSSAVTEKKNQTSKKAAPRKRIICFDDSTESTESVKSPDDFHKKIPENETGWTCPACTLLNKPSRMTCELCDCEKPSPQVTSQPAWTCKSCTYINGGQDDVCNMCGKLRMHPKSKQKARKSDERQQPCTSRDESFTNIRLTDADRHKVLPGRADKSQPTNMQDTSCSASASRVVGTPTGNLEIEERLKRVMKKRLDFKAKRESLGAHHQVKVPMKSVGQDQDKSTSDAKPSAQDVINSSVVSPAKKSDTVSGPIVVLVDSKELSSSQPIITMLRSKFEANVTVASLPHCDYIIGIGTAVTRLMLSEVSQVSSKQKLSTKFQQLNVHYDRVYAIIEQDSVKKGDWSRRIIRSTHFMSMMCCLAQCNIRVLYSDNQDETAGILKMLAARERDLKRAISVDAAAKANDSNSRLLLKLFLNMPKVSFVSALYMCLHFKTFKEAASSSVEKLIQKAHLSTYAAAEVYTFCRRKFDIQMTPTR